MRDSERPARPVATRWHGFLHPLTEREVKLGLVVVAVLTRLVVKMGDEHDSDDAKRLPAEAVAKLPVLSEQEVREALAQGAKDLADTEAEPSASAEYPRIMFT
jgi:hypothetical protein